MCLALRLVQDDFQPTFHLHVLSLKNILLSSSIFSPPRSLPKLSSQDDDGADSKKKEVPQFEPIPHDHNFCERVVINVRFLVSLLFARTTIRRPSISNNFFTFCVWRNARYDVFNRWSSRNTKISLFLGQRLKIWNTIASLEPVSRHTLGRSSPPYQVVLRHFRSRCRLIQWLTLAGTSIRSATNTFSIETVRVLMQFYIIIKVVSVGGRSRPLASRTLDYRSRLPSLDPKNNSDL